MKKSRWTLGVAAVLAAGLLPACATGGAASGGADADDQIVIGVTNTSMKTPVYEVMREAALEKAEELGAEVIWQSAEFDANAQLSQVQNMIAEGIDVLVIEPVDNNAAAQHVQLALDAGIPVVNLEYYIEGADLSLRIVADSEAVGELQVQTFVDNWDGSGEANAVILSGTSGSEIADSITAGNEKGIEDAGNINVVAQQNHNNWDQELALKTMENVLLRENNDVQVVFANNDEMILGAYRAAQQAGVADDIIFVGSDHDEMVVQAILDGANMFTVDKGARTQGERITEGAIAVAKGEEIPQDEVIDDIPVWWTPVAVVDSENLELSEAKFPQLFG
ncbi:substrate-binding domain-containing protein [Leucobacter sp. L43]|uniref:substrate-binding domain-containing protein n=1 Tax=Leucobacter sp. L43 TaxID=2798040 RepID=UPI0019037CBF|nr:substrate-binding domain-containing protein [Leucobacter sp. L43]